MICNKIDGIGDPTFIQFSDVIIDLIIDGHRCWVVDFEHVELYVVPCERNKNNNELDPEEWNG